MSPDVEGGSTPDRPECGTYTCVKGAVIGADARDQDSENETQPGTTLLPVWRWDTTTRNVNNAKAKASKNTGAPICRQASAPPPADTGLKPTRRFHKIRGSHLFMCWFELPPTAHDVFSAGPPVCPHVKPGDLLSWCEKSTASSARVWIRTTGGEWDEIEEGHPHPTLYDRVLHILANGEPRWITRRTASTYKSRRGAQSSTTFCSDALSIILFESRDLQFSMLRNSSQTSKSQKKPKRPKLKVVKFDSPPANSPPLKKLKPLTAFAKPTVRSEALSSGDERIDPKGKSRAVDCGSEHQDDQLWTEMYEPTVEADLAVHKKKIEDIRRWLLEAFDGGPSGKLKKYRRILALTGPAGTGKTTTIRILARELGFEILEWKNSIEVGFSRDDLADEPAGFRRPMDYESLSEKFESFLARASTCSNLFTAESLGTTSQPSQLSSRGQSQASNSMVPYPTIKRKIILLEDLPNILHPRTQQNFHSALQHLVDSANPGTVPVVIIVSDAGSRGEEMDARISQLGGSRGRDVVDVRTVLPPSLLGSAYVTQIGFNPIAPTFLRAALQSLLKVHFSTTRTKRASPPKEVLDIIVESANGDIRSAIMGLQFACLVELPNEKRGKSKSLGGRGRAKVVLDAVTRREQSLALFHLMGKVLYNKRKGDPPNASATAKDIQRESDLDSRLRNPPSHPFLKMHDRRASRVDVDMLYADSPIDSSLFSLYIHQNYTQFCNELEESEGVSQWLSWVDSSGGEAWHQSNPHRFHLLTLGTLHSLPSPVPRRSQKMLKPEFFQFRNREKDAWDAVGDVRRWVYANSGDTGTQRDDDNSSWITGGWNMISVATELGGILKARDANGMSNQPPSSHKLFSRLMFIKNDGLAQELAEGDLEDVGREDAEDDEGQRGRNMGGEKTSGGWLETDDIEDY